MNDIQNEDSRPLDQDEEFNELVRDIIDLIERSRQETADMLNQELESLELDGGQATSVLGRNLDETMNDPRIRVLLDVGMGDLHLGEPLREAVIKRIRDGLLGRTDYLYCYMASDALGEGYELHRLVNLAMYHRGWRRVALFDFIDNQTETVQPDRVNAALDFFGGEARDREENPPILITFDLRPSGDNVGLEIYCRQEDYRAPDELLRDIAWTIKQIGLQDALVKDYGWD